MQTQDVYVLWARRIRVMAETLATSATKLEKAHPESQRAAELLLSIRHKIEQLQKEVE